MAEITIGVPIYFGDKFEYVEECLKSIKNQTFKDFEVIIVFEGYSSKFERLVNDFLYSYNVHVILNKSPLGLANALNQMLDLCNTKFLKRMDSDDIMNDNAIEILRKYCVEDFAVVGSAGTLIDTDNYEFGIYSKRIFEGKLPFSTLLTPPFIHPSVVLNVKYLKSEGIRYNSQDVELVSIMIEDWHLWNQIRFKGGSGKVLPNHLIKYRVKNHDRQFLRFKESIQIKRKYLKEFSLNPFEYQLSLLLIFIFSNSLSLIKEMYKFKYSSK